MKRIKRIIKLSAIFAVAVVSILVLATILFVKMSPQFGGVPKEDQLKSFVSASNFKDGKFQNQIPTHVGLTFRQTISVANEFFFGNKPGKSPASPPPVSVLDFAMVADRSKDISRLTWFGHSAILLEVDGKKIFLDPMLGQHAGPLPLISPKRYNKDLPIEIEDLPFIDAVLISHDHYDHLDYGSVRKLKDKVGRFYVPLGVGAHLRAWGVNPEIITELNWWEEAQYEGFTFISAPARHFSGRAFTNNTTLWCSWIIRTSGRQLYFSGDSGYGPHFKEIAERYGSMDLAMMECGQYNDLWTAIHMMPEETVRAALDVGAKSLLPIHWGAFTLAMHTWTDPIDRVTTEARRVGIPIATPRIGEMVQLDDSPITDVPWW